MSSVGDLYISAGGANTVYKVKKGDPASAKTVYATFPNFIRGLSFDSYDNLYVGGYSACKVFKVNNVTAVVTTVAGTGTCGAGTNGALATSYDLYNVENAVVSLSGDIYISGGTGRMVQKLDRKTNTITRIAGPGTGNCGNGDGGLAINAYLGALGSISLDSHGNIFIADANCGTVRFLNMTTGILSTIAGRPNVIGNTGDNGPATSASLSSQVWHPVYDSDNNFLYIVQGAATGGDNIRMVDLNTGIITSAVSSGLSDPRAMAYDTTTGNAYIVQVTGGIVFGLGIATQSPAPSFEPSYLPSFVPTFVPTFAPSMPTSVPTFAPSMPTFVPTFKPSTIPTSVPSATPTFDPSVTPTFSPTFAPSVTPTFVPSVPTLAPTFTPSFTPTSVPSVTPTFSPSVTPTFVPTFTPSVTPTYVPSAMPTVVPSFTPSATPTNAVVANALSAGAYAGISFAGLLFLIICCCCCFYLLGFWRRRKSRKDEKHVYATNSTSNELNI